MTKRVVCFGNKRIIVNSLLKRLFTQKKISVQSANSIKLIFDTNTECIKALKNLNLYTISWDPLIIFLVTQKVDSKTHCEWEEVAYDDNDDDLPTLDALNKFLRSKYRTLDTVTLHLNLSKPQ